MRCPKCGYNSFDHLDTCKKCGKDLIEFKEKFGIKSVLFPGRSGRSEDVVEELHEDVADVAVAATAAAVGAASADVGALGVEEDFGVEPPAASAGESDDFGFDFMGDSAEDDDLSFDELFEEAAEEEDLEESIEGPADKTPEPPAENTAADDFDFPEDEDEELDDFGFDLDEPEGGEKGDPKDPFDLPESAQNAWAPESPENFSAEESDGAEAGDLADDHSSPVDELPVLDEVSLPLTETFEISEAESRGAGDGLEKPEPVAEFSEPFVIPAEDGIASLPEPDTDAEEFACVELSDNAEAGQVVLAAQLPELEEPETLAAGESFALPAEPEQEPEPVISSSEAIATAVYEEEAVTEDDSVELILMPGEVPAVASRILAFVYDLTLLLIVLVAFMVVSEMAMSSGPLRLIPSAETLLELSIPYFLVAFALVFGYFTMFHFLTGQTPGKMLTSLRVESVEREPLSLGQAFLRSFGGVIQLIPVGLGFLSILLYPYRRGLSDRLAGTLVVSVKAGVPQD